MKRKLTKPQLIACIILGSGLLGSVIFMLGFSPVPIYVKRDLNPYEININDLKLKNIVGMVIVGNPKKGFNTLRVAWPIWSDCGLPYLEVVQYNMFRKEINIWIWGDKGICIQLAALIEHTIEIYIPLAGNWIISCNNISIRVNI